MALIVCGLYSFPSIFTLQSVPIWRFTELIVRSGLVTACLLALSPISLSPFFVNATTLGVVMLPDAPGMITGTLFSITETQLFVVPRSIPITFPMLLLLLPDAGMFLLRPHGLSLCAAPFRQFIPNIK